MQTPGHAGNSDYRKASSLSSRSLKDARLASRNSLLWTICARAAAAILLYSKACKMMACSMIKGYEREVELLCHHRSHTDVVLGVVMAADGLEGIPSGQRGCLMCRRFRRL